jgi:hypothetical protein
LITLKKHQREAIEFVFRERAGRPSLIAHATGTGKTLTGCGVGLHAMRKVKADFLVLGKASLYRSRWLPDWTAITGDGTPLLNLTAKPADKRTFPEDDGVPAAAYCSHDSVNGVLTASLLDRRMRGADGSMTPRPLVIVVDECHKMFADNLVVVKKKKSKRRAPRRNEFAGLVRRTRGQGKPVVLVFESATPVRNHPSELHSLFYLSAATTLEPMEFKNYFFDLKYRNGMFAGHGDFKSSRHRQEFLDTLAPLCHVRSPEDAGFPPVSMDRIEVKAPPMLALEGLPEEREEFPRCSARLAELKIKHLADSGVDWSRGNHLLFYKHRSVGELLRSVLVDVCGGNYVGVVDGGVPDKLREKLRSRYVTEGGVLAVSSGVGSEGYDICHPDGQTVEVLELPWTWCQLVQILGRVRRLSTIGVKSKVNYYVWTSPEGRTFDEIADSVISRKRGYELESLLEV